MSGGQLHQQSFAKTAAAPTHADARWLAPTTVDVGLAVATTTDDGAASDVPLSLQGKASIEQLIVFALSWLTLGLSWPGSILFGVRICSPWLEHSEGIINTSRCEDELFNAAVAATAAASIDATSAASASDESRSALEDSSAAAVAAAVAAATLASSRASSWAAHAASSALAAAASAARL